MPWPQHENPRDDIARAPYNFVPLPERVVYVNSATLPSQGVYHPSPAALTGSIVCRLTTETPVYVRAPLTLEEFDRQEQEKDKKEKKPAAEQVKNKPDFYYTDPARQPRIPGSSVRGMLRSLVEIVSYSKVEYVSDQQLVYRSVGDTTQHGEMYRQRIMHYDSRPGERPQRFTPKVEAGYIVKDHGEWHIRPAQLINGTSFARIRIKDIPDNLQRLKGTKNSSIIYVQPGAYEYQEVREGFLEIRFARVVHCSHQWEPGLVKDAAALARSGPMLSKRSEAVIFPRDPDAQPIPIGDELVRAYKDQQTPEQIALLGEDGVLREGHPVFFLRERGELVFFGHTMMMRLPYEKSPRDFVPSALREPPRASQATERGKWLDLAEAIFGYTKDEGQGKERAYASRVFVEDAVLVSEGDPWLTQTPITPRILGSPKPTTFQHYLAQPKPDATEIGRTRDGRAKTIKELKDYASSVDKTVLRGHKLYWHKHGPLTVEDIAETPERLAHTARREAQGFPDTQHTRLRPVKAGVDFEFRVRFENLSPVELGALLWALVLPGDPARAYRHKIGMGRPLGMGTVHLTPRLYLEERDARYTRLLDEEQAAWFAPTAEATEQMSDYIGAFEAFMREQPGDSNTAFTAVDRIAMLLKLLEWPGPPNEQTRYLEIEHPDPDSPRGKINEYKSRPVLPDPLAVAGERRPAPVRSQAQAPVARPLAPPAPAEAAPPPPATPIAPTEVRRGIIVEIRPDLRRGRVRDVETGKEYAFDTRVIQGNTPARKSEVVFDVQGGRVTGVRRA